MTCSSLSRLPKMAVESLNPRSKIRSFLFHESWEDFLLVTVQLCNSSWKKETMLYGSETGIPRSIFIELLTLGHYDLFPRSHLFSAFLLLLFFLLSSIFLPDDILRFDPSRTIRSVEPMLDVPMNKCRWMQRIVA